jgi:hypothetical protein
MSYVLEVHREEFGGIMYLYWANVEVWQKIFAGEGEVEEILDLLKVLRIPVEVK